MGEEYSMLARLPQVEYAPRLFTAVVEGWTERARAEDDRRATKSASGITTATGRLRARQGPRPRFSWLSWRGRPPVLILLEGSEHETPKLERNRGQVGAVERRNLVRPGRGLCNRRALFRDRRRRCSHAELPPVKWIPQGWDEKVTKAFHRQTQGSKIMPIEWFQVLEQPVFTPLPVGRFVERDYLARYGFIYESDQPATDQPDLPIGWAIDAKYIAKYDIPPVNTPTRMVGLTAPRVTPIAST